VSVFSGPAKLKKEYPLTPTGEYVATLNDLSYETGGTYGDSLLWKWLLAPVTDPTNYIARDDGMERVFHEYTNPDIIVGSKPHEWIAALSGIVLGEGDEPPESDDLIGKRMLVYVAHQAPKQGPNAGKLKERLVAGSSKPFNLVPAKRVAVPQASRPAAPAAQDRDAIVKRVEKLIGKAVMLETPNHLNYVAEDINAAETDYLIGLAAEIEDEVKAAVAA
jgi:hypothetical protein